MDCAEAKLRIEPYVAGELSADEKAPLEIHLETCAECRLDSELTRASRNAPSDPPPPMEPVSAGGAGSGDPDAPSGTSAGGKPPGDWTLETIFGAGGSGAAGTVGAVPPSAAPPSVVPPSATSDLSSGDAAPPADDSTSPSREEESQADHEPSDPFTEADETPLPEVLESPVTSKAAPSLEIEEEEPSWDFEPADQKSGAKPPEGSLFFAEEALSRADGSGKGKPSVLRLALWCAGSVVGLGLLAVSVWVALSIRQPATPSTGFSGKPLAAGSGPSTPEPPSTSAIPPEPNPEPAPVVAPEVAPPPQVAKIPEPAAVEPRVPAKTEPETERASTPAPRVAPKPVPAPHRPRTDSTPSSGTRVVASKPAPAPAPSKAQALVIETPKPVMPPVKSEPIVPSDQDLEPTPSPTVAMPPASTAVPPASTVTTPQATPTPEPPAAEAVQQPIDRLHLATLNAEQNADLTALRKMRDTWRGFVKTSVGPDRARAKRELADCLWAIQTLTTKTSDKREALVAYRDYLLNAPAGGADARTVARMRQLEDAVAESH